MPHFTMKKSRLRKAAILILLFACFLGAFSAIGLWENHQREQALASQAQIDDAARRRREGWIEVDGQWYAPRTDLETLLVIGVDKMEPLVSSGSYNNDGQADFLLLTIFDKTAKTTTILHINRDTMTDIPILGVTGEPAGTIFGQLALAHTYGDGLEDSCENTVKAVSMLLDGVKIDHYVGMTMGAVPLLNDMVGGVTVTVLDDFTGIDDSLVKGETITLQGEQALHYVRIRRGLEDSTNLNRMKRQQQYLAALTEKIESLGDDFSPSFSQLDQLSEYIVSDCTIQQLSDISKRYAGYEMAEEMEDIKGEARQGTEFVEYYPDEAALQQQVLSLFYVPKEA